MGLRDALRKMAAGKDDQPMVSIPVLNDPTKVISMPESYREGVLDAYGIKTVDLVGEAPFHAIFVREGIAFGILSKHPDGGVRTIIHGVDLRPGEEANILMVGSEVYNIWKSFPTSKLMTYEQLTKNYDKLPRALQRSN